MDHGGCLNPFTIFYEYDRNGNTIKKIDGSLTNQEVTFIYNTLNQLVETKRGPPEAEIILGRYDYNAAGLRVRHRLSERGDVDYYYDDNAVIEERNAADDTLLAHYRYADRLVSLDMGGARQYYHHDALGSTVNLTTDSAEVQVSYKLDPWGHIREQIGTSVNRQIFTGQEHDENTGLIYFGARYYDPDTARFLNQDSYLGESNTPPSLHRYLYAYSNPTIYVDPLGYDSVRIDNDTVYWDVLKDWPGFINPYIGSFEIGVMKDNKVYLTQEFGGGIVSAEFLKEAASKFWGRHGTDEIFFPSDISGLDQASQKEIVSIYLENINIRKETFISAEGSWTSHYPVRSKFDKIDAKYGISTRVDGAIEVGTAAGEATVAGAGIAAPEPATTVAGLALFWHAVDVGGHGLYKIITGRPSQTFTSQGFQKGFETLGADESTAHYYAEWSNAGAMVLGPGGVLRLTQMARSIPLAANASKSGANNVAQFEKLRSSLSADEILNAERIGTALSKSDAGHRAASFLTKEQLAAGKTFGIRGGDGVQRTLLQTKGELSGKSGIFEYILNPKGQVTHQRFVKGGKITGSPNQVVPKGGY